MESNLKYDMNELIHKTETDLQISKTNFWLSKGKHACGRRDKSGAWDEYSHTTIYKRDTPEDLLYSTGNSNLYSVISYMRKESKKE